MFFSLWLRVFPSARRGVHTFLASVLRTVRTRQNKKKKARSRQLLWDKGETAKKGRGALAAARVRLDESRTLVPFDELCVQSHSVAV